MRRFVEIALILEFIIGFGPLIVFWVIALLISPLIVSGATKGEMPSLLMLVGLLFGPLGIWGLVSLFGTVKQSEQRSIERNKIFIYLACGLIALLIAHYSIYTLTDKVSYILWLPVVVTIHFIYLSRKQLWAIS